MGVGKGGGRGDEDTLVCCLANVKEAASKSIRQLWFGSRLKILLHDGYANYGDDLLAPCRRHAVDQKVSA